MVILPAASRNFNGQRNSPAPVSHRSTAGVFDSIRPTADVFDSIRPSSGGAPFSRQRAGTLRKDLIERHDEGRWEHHNSPRPQLVRQQAARELSGKSGKVLKLTAHHHWISKILSLSRTQLVIADDNNDSQDYILLHEISKVEVASSNSGRRSSDPIERVESADKQSAPEHPSADLFRRISLPSSRTSQRIDVRIFEIHTKWEGTHAGRIFFFKTESTEDCRQWVDEIQEKSRLRMREVRHQTILALWRDGARKIYQHDLMQLLLALLIMANFGINAYQAEFHPETMISNDAEGGDFYVQIDIILTSIFVVELALNMFCDWFWPFVSNGWNIFDFCIVTLSLLSLLVAAIPGLNFLRVLRAFRLIRVIRRFRSLKRIFDALVQSVIPVLNAFVIGVIVTFIYAITGVFLFQEESPEKFGTFNRALVSLFMLVGGMGYWGSDGPVLFDEEGNLQKVTLAYLFSFVAIVLWTCLQVVVAVLLDNFLSATQYEKREAAMKHQHENRKQGSPLDPLLRVLTNNFDSEDDLEKDIQEVFNILDIDDSNGLSHKEMAEGFGRLKLVPKIEMSADDLRAILEHSLGHTEDEITLEQFRKMMWIQLRRFTQQAMHDAAAVSYGDPAMTSVLWGMKLNLIKDNKNDVEHEDPRLVKMQEQIDNIQTGMGTILALLQEKHLPVAAIASKADTPRLPEKSPLGKVPAGVKALPDIPSSPIENGWSRPVTESLPSLRSDRRSEDIPLLPPSNGLHGTDRSLEGNGHSQKFKALDSTWVEMANSRSFDPNTRTKDPQPAIASVDPSNKMGIVQVDLGLHHS
mmetsp:Transcript_2845/g.5748  ORF Transcript_2845/g.5748 Transcript_2845/m.5748 type:complete len:808 (-) Transcript_2845:175-2598(-)|eukprot:CAMPEP_0181333604 /NCGR_PEP_ID=MMETSP1101-20121128/25771_1 /TAXON_ID=46948 /ORGANISM="Rhodomonas abbreviata, Strain Caron Lab Isolate" /LENGTH=807 /DNA_ID=CAMNT_0023443437 /DNA_START=177 /DNA_END=2600 /DNA_ORIENTATION=+